MPRDKNDRETGARKYPAVPEEYNRDEATDAALPDKPEPYGLTEAPDDSPEKTRHSDGRRAERKPTPSPSTEKVSGAGPAVAEHSKDAKAPKAGRLPGAYVKD